MLLFFHLDHLHLHAVIPVTLLLKNPHRGHETSINCFVSRHRVKLSPIVTAVEGFIGKLESKLVQAVVMYGPHLDCRIW